MSTLVFDFQEPMRAFFFPLFAADLTACISDRHFRLRHRSSTLFAASLLPSSEDLASSAAGQCISMASNQLTPHAQTPPHLPQLQTDISSPLAVQSLIHLEQLRETARDYIFKNLYSGAIFFADKAVTISKGDPDDIFFLAQCFVFDGEYKRALYLLQQYELPDRSNDLRFHYLAAHCYIKTNRYAECIAVLGEDEERFRSLLASTDLGADFDPCKEVDLRAALCLLRAKAYEAMDKVLLAIEWYQESLRYDLKCVESLQLLFGRRMLPRDKEQAFLAELKQRIPEGYQWLYDNFTGVAEQQKQQSSSASSSFSISSSSSTNRNAAASTPLAGSQTEAQDGGIDMDFSDNVDIMTQRVSTLFYQNDIKLAYELSKQKATKRDPLRQGVLATEIIKRDPFHQGALVYHVCCLVELGLKEDLFAFSHQLVDAYPEQALSWFAVGAYYYLTQKYDQARKFFSKATVVDSQCAPAWIGYGHCFAAQDESDQAMAAYRRAERLLQGNWFPLTFIGMEYLRTNSLMPARAQLKLAESQCATDPLVLNELGVVAYRSGNYPEAVGYLTRAVRLIKSDALELWEILFTNLAHSYRKQRMFSEALQQYDMALTLSPKNHSIYSAIGFTYHCMDKLDMAAEYYHKALGSCPTDTFAADMLSRALSEMFHVTLPIHTPDAATIAAVAAAAKS